MVVTAPANRFLFLEELDYLGSADGPDRFHVHWEFILQMRMLFSQTTGRHLDRIMTGEMASELADMIEGMRPDDRGWKTHLAMWNDEQGDTVRSLVRFLRQGGFAFVNLVPSA